MLEQYFKPHTIFSFISFIYLLVTFEISGWGLVKVLNIKTPQFLRPAIWLLGLGQVVFLIFISHFFIPYNGLLFILFSTLLALPWVKSYFSTKQPKNIRTTLSLLFPILLVFSPLIPLVFIKTSLPPYLWDEAVYHYISPYKLFYEKVWHFRGLYDSVPRLIDTAYVSFFALTKSYASARLLHFFIYFTSLSSIYLFIKKHLGTTIGLVTFIILTFLHIPLLIQSTWGYIDLAVSAFIVLAVLSLVEFLLKKDVNLVYLSLLFCSLGLGTKYNALAPSLVISSLFLFQIISSRYFKKIKVNILLPVILTSLILGGYWYVKNWFITGNPIFPFLFSCKVPGCGVGQSFFDWTIALTIKNLPLITKQLLFNHWFLTPLSVAIIFLSLFLSRKNVRKILLVLLSTVVGEYILLSFFAGFTLRYFYHWLIILNIIFAISLSVVIKKILSNVPSGLKNIILITGLIVALFIGGKRMLDMYKKYLPHQELYYQTRFALGRANTIDWIKWTLPATSEAIIWCDKQDKLTTLVVKDPLLLWFTKETMFPIYLTNCKVREGPDQEKEYYLSLDDCSVPGQLLPRLEGEDEKRREMAFENQTIICNSELIVKSLYTLKVKNDK